MIEKPANGRAIITQGINSLNISIPAKKNWFAITGTSINCLLDRKKE